MFSVMLPSCALPRRLLHLFIRYVEVRQLVAEHQAQAVIGGEVAVVAGGKITRGSVVRVVFGTRRTEIAAGHCTVGTDSKGVLPREILQHGVAASGVKTAS